MLELYQTNSCHYCAKVRTVLQDLNIVYVSHDASPGTPERERLIELGGKGQVPFLVDTTDREHPVMMYESDDIIQHLQRIRHSENTH